MSKKHELSESDRCLRAMALIIATIEMILVIVYAATDNIPEVLVGLLPILCSIVANLIAFGHCGKRSRRGYAALAEYIDHDDPDDPDQKPMTGKAKFVLVLDITVAITGVVCWVTWTIVLASAGTRHNPILSTFMLCLLIILWIIHLTLVVKTLRHKLHEIFRDENNLMPPKCERCGFIQGITDRNGHRYRLIREDLDRNIGNLYRDSEDSDATHIDVNNLQQNAFRNSAMRNQTQQQQAGRESLDTSVWSVPTARPSGESEHVLSKTR